MKHVTVPVFEVKCYDLVVVEFTLSHAAADEAYRKSTARRKTLTKIMPVSGQRITLQSVYG